MAWPTALPHTQQLAQLMLANFDQNGDGALNQAELESALLAWMQQMQAQQMRFAQQMGNVQAFAAAGAQGNCQAGGAAAMNQIRAQNRNGQFATRQDGMQASGGGRANRGGGGGGGVGRRGR